MTLSFEPGDMLVFQLEAGYALIRVLGSEGSDSAKVWHLAGYSDLFPDVDSAELAAADPAKLHVSDKHMAITNRAFESTQVARIANAPLTDEEIAIVTDWHNNSERSVSDRSVRLLMGLR